MTRKAKLGFRCVKATLISLYVLSLIAVICLIAISIIGLSVVESHDVNPDHKLTLEEKEETRHIFRQTIVIATVSLVLLLIGLVGVIKENKLVIIAITVFGIVETIVYVVKSNLILAFIELLSTILTGVYAYMIMKIDKFVTNV